MALFTVTATIAVQGTKFSDGVTVTSADATSFKPAALKASTAKAVAKGAAKLAKKYPGHKVVVTGCMCVG